MAFDCPGGTNEIIKNEVNGFLSECGNVDKLVHTIIKASTHNFNQKTIINFIYDKYNTDKIIKKYERIL